MYPCLPIFITCWPSYIKIILKDRGQDFAVNYVVNSNQRFLVIMDKG